MKQYLWVFDAYATEIEISEFKKLVAQPFKNISHFHYATQKFLSENEIEDGLFDEIYTLENFCEAFNDECISDQHTCFVVNVEA